MKTNPRIAIVLPWYHSFGLLTTLGLSLGGCTIIASPKYTKTKFLQSIQVNNFL